uniref:CYCD31 protein n=1 Tax=Magnolia wufengensis TaxID=517426 RepID=A0A411D331_9MAGN|nr:CYCD3;1 protein [Magnolia wufengensis]
MTQHHHQPSPLFLLDALYCQEEHWEEEDEEEDEQNSYSEEPQPSPLLFLLQQDLFWDDDDLLSLLSKEQETHLHLPPSYLDSDPCLASARREAVDWMLRVNAHYGFTPLAAVLSVDYLDRFLSSLHFQKDKPWMTQLAAVACLSLAAKVEETQVPLLLDLQVEDSKYVFEAKTIQRMELLVLSTLKWKMNPVTPLSFIDHIIRRLGLKTHLHWEFLRRCERLILSVIADSRLVSYLPSVFAAATMLHVIHQLEPCNPLEYKNQLMGVLKINKEKVRSCFQKIAELNSSPSAGCKRKYPSTPTSPNGVMDSSIFSCDSSNDSWVLSVPSSPKPAFKKNRPEDQQPMQLPSLHRPFVDVLSSSP